MKPVKKMNIAIAVPAFPNIMQTYILRQLAGFKSMGIKTCILASEKRVYDKLPATILKNKMLNDVTYINTSFRHIFKNIISLPLFNISYLRNAIKILAFDYPEAHSWSYRLKSLIRARALTLRPIEIIHSHSMFSSYNYLFMKEVLSIPLITTYHGQVPKGVTRLESDKLQLVLDTGDAFIVNTRFAKDELIQLGCPAHKIHTIPQGINLDRFHFSEHKINPDKKIICLTVGRLSIEKGHIVALKAIKSLTKTYPTLEYHIIGEGPGRQNLSNFVNANKLSNQIIFHGFKSGDELQQIFSSAHIFILPSITTGDGYLVETQGVVLQEAQAFGIPVIGSRTGGIPDVINNEATGLLYRESDAADLANTISMLIENPDLYTRLCEQGRKDVERRFDINKICEQLLKLYKSKVKQT